ncbi:hypothetical protein BSL78_22084 [Apostichopus japonicus]|uniref:N-acetyltransferase domain-containing protein n=1 Tax=Stichopus japonicus TaxID=307972 RepID=A0A2G8JZC0_STIJA|nr:hypothetical protein BSL78_22084 [Apostichopus japonicus]
MKDDTLLSLAGSEISIAVSFIHRAVGIDRSLHLPSGTFKKLLEKSSTFTSKCSYRAWLKVLGSCGYSHNATTDLPFKLRKVHSKEAAVIGSSRWEDDLRLKAADYKLFYNLDPSGYFVATTDKGEVAGVIGAPRLTHTDGTIGFQHVHEDLKDKGLEETLWTAALKNLENRKISIEVSSEEVKFCQQLGFHEAWRNGLFKGTGAKLLPHVSELTNSPVLKQIKDIPFSKVVYFDETIVGFERVNFLYKWTNVSYPAAALTTYADDEVVGYGVLRELHLPNTYFVGPLYANNVAMAQVMLVALISNIPDKTYFIRSPLNNLSFMKLLTDQLYMEQIGETVRMYNQEEHNFPVHKALGLISPDIGS